MVDILVATYNGENYLDEQLSSIFNQSYQDFRVLVHDDVSCDDTIAIIQKWHECYPDRVQIISSEERDADAGQSFFDLLDASTERYAMFCDQDDVWTPQKVSDSLRWISEEEKLHPGLPVLLHTDLTVVDETLHTISDSFVRLQHIDATRSTLPQLIAQNNATGCTMTLNRDLIKLMRRPPAPMLHDRWAALTASAFGCILYRPERTVLYRQHNSNAVGAKNAAGAANLAKKLLHIKEIRKSLYDTYNVASIFLEKYSDMLSEEQKRFLEEYSSLKTSSPFKRFQTLSRYGAFKNGVLRSAGQVILG